MFYFYLILLPVNTAFFVSDIATNQIDWVTWLNLVAAAISLLSVANIRNREATTK